MTISIGQVGSVTVSQNNSTGIVTGAVNTAASGSGFVVVIMGTTNTTTTLATAVTDSFGNTYTQLSQIKVTTGGANYTADRWYVAPGAAGYVGGGSSHTATVTPTVGGTANAIAFFVTLIEMPGAATGNANFYKSSASHSYPFSNAGPYALTSLTITPPAGGAALVSGFICQSPASGTGSESTGFATNYTVDTASNGGAIGTKIVSAANTYTPSWSWSIASVEAFSSMDAFFGAAAVGGEGTTTGATSAATGQGTGGVVMPAITAGQELDVIVGIQNSSLPSTLVVNDGSNTYTQIDTFNDAGNGFIWYRFASKVTVALTTPTITATANAGYFPTSMSIAAFPLAGVTGFTGGNVAHNQQLSPGGTDSQVSGFTPSLLGGPGINYTVAAYGFSASKATAPTAGTGFTPIATAWAALGTGACLTYETMQLGSGGAPVQATFTPTTSRAYTLVAAFNNIQLPVSPAGPMPRQIYIMP